MEPVRANFFSGDTVSRMAEIFGISPCVSSALWLYPQPWARASSLSAFSFFSVMR